MGNAKRRMTARLAVTAAIMVAGFGVVSAHAENKLIVKDATGTTDQMVVTDSGFIGIGTSAPTGPLDIRSSGTNYLKGSVTLKYTAAGASPPGSAAPNLSMYRNNEAAVNDGLPRANDMLGFFNFGSMVNGTPKNAALVWGVAEKNWTTSTFPSFLKFNTTAEGAASSAERMRITSSGNMGIGTTVPKEKLEVNGGVRLNAATVKPDCGPDARGTMWFSQGGNGAKDSLEVCAKDAAGNYDWRLLY